MENYYQKRREQVDRCFNGVAGFIFPDIIVAALFILVIAVQFVIDMVFFFRTGDFSQTYMTQSIAGFHIRMANGTMSLWINEALTLLRCYLGFKAGVLGIVIVACRFHVVDLAKCFAYVILTDVLKMNNGEVCKFLWKDPHIYCDLLSAPRFNGKYDSYLPRDC